MDNKSVLDYKETMKTLKIKIEKIQIKISENNKILSSELIANPVTIE